MRIEMKVVGLLILVFVALFGEVDAQNVYTLNITVGAASGCFQGTGGIGAGFYLNGTNRPALSANVGDAITFSTSALSGHVFALTTNSGGGGSAVTSIASLSGTNSFTWIPSTIGLYYYVCTVNGHTCMGNSINVSNVSTATTATTATPTTAATTAAATTAAASTAVATTAPATTGSGVAYTYAITVGSASGCFQGTGGIGAGFYLNGANRPAVSAKVGDTLTFSTSGLSGHVFALTTDGGGGGTTVTAITSLVGTNSYTWVPSAAGTYYYVCTVTGHTCMGNSITIAAAAAPTTAAAVVTPTTYSYGVSVAPKNAANPVCFQGNGTGIGVSFFLNGTDRPGLTMNVGDTLTISTTNLNTHVFVITSDAGGGGAAVATLAAVQGTNSTSWTPTIAGTYYYVCAVPHHTCMGNSITVNALASSTTAAPTTKSPINSATHTPANFLLLTTLFAALAFLFY